MSDWIADAQARCETATEGPWVATTYASRDAVLTGDGSGYFICNTGGGYGSEEDAAFIAAARTDLPRALTALGAVLAKCDEIDNDETVASIFATMFRCVIADALKAQT